MISSMTAFGRGVNSAERANITCEIRSVNSRYLDCTVKMPRMFASLEERVKARLAYHKITRGKIDIYIGAEMKATPASYVKLDEGAAASYLAALCELRDKFGLKDDISTMRIAQNKDIFTSDRPEEDEEEDWALILPALDAAAEAHVAMRMSEGERIEKDIRGKIDWIESRTPEIAAYSDEDVKNKRDKLTERIGKILEENNVIPDESRLLTECALFADRIAIDEELVRLSSHFTAFRDILSGGGAVGRKLDFLLQEINRETNTIGSKCSNLAISHIVVDIKGELEKVREQIQNIE